MAPDQSSKKPSDADESLNSFLSRTQAWQDPSAVYTFDSGHGAARTVICRELSSQPETRQYVDHATNEQLGRGRQKNCIALDMYSTQLFEAMQGPNLDDVIKSPGGLLQPGLRPHAGRHYSFDACHQIDMQNYGFYCALPSDPSRTHMVCRRLPK